MYSPVDEAYLLNEILGEYTPKNNITAIFKTLISV